MKLAITPTEFPFGVIAQPADTGYRLIWFKDKNKLPESVLIDSDFIRKRCGLKELTDYCSVYIEVDLLTGMITAVHNKMATTMLTKSNGREYAMKHGVTIAAQLYIPFADSDPTDWVLRVNANPGIGIDVPEHTPTVENTRDAFYACAAEVFPSIKIAHSKRLESGCYEIAAQLTYQSQPLAKAGIRLFANAESGYINKREAYTDAQGIALFRARRLDLDPNEAMSVELGFKYAKNLCHVNVPND